MIRRFEDVTDDVVRGDVCVIGAGAAGITLALQLAESGLQIVLLEAGGDEYDASSQDHYDGDVVGAPLGDLPQDRALALSRLRYLGGTTNHWAGYCRPLIAADFRVRPELEWSGWPIGLAELTPYYERALPVFGFDAPSYDWADWHAQSGVEDPFASSSILRTAAFQVNPVRFGPRYRPFLGGYQSVDLILGATVVDLTIQDGTDRIGSVSVAGGGVGVGGFKVEASAFVLATGGIENARTLLSADSQRSAGLGNEHDLVGRFFSDHPKAFVGVAVSDMPGDELAKIFGNGTPVLDDAGDEKFSVRGSFVIDDEDRRSGRRLGVAFDGLIGTTEPTPVDGTRGLTFNEIATFAGRSTGADQTTRLHLLATGEQQLDPESRVRLSDRRDVHGRRRVSLDWRFSSLDRESMLDGVRVIGRELGALGIGRAQVAPAVDANGGDPSAGSTSFPMGVSFHHCCTTRMSADPTTGVVDANLRVHSLDNLFVAGSSSFATPGAATPTFTIVALAIRLADQLRAVLA